MHGEAGKGSARRPLQTTREEYDLRCMLANGKIKFEEYNRKWNKLLREGKIKRDGKVIGCNNEQEECKNKTREKA